LSGSGAGAVRSSSKNSRASGPISATHTKTAGAPLGQFLGSATPWGHRNEEAHCTARVTELGQFSRLTGRRVSLILRLDEDREPARHAVIESPIYPEELRFERQLKFLRHFVQNLPVQLGAQSMALPRGPKGLGISCIQALEERSPEPVPQRCRLGTIFRLEDGRVVGFHDRSASGAVCASAKRKPWPSTSNRLAR